MNADNLKSELQQVLDTDVLLRKEFNELKRSLSDYRNQLIERDEDCKRLQVTIDVLNTKMTVTDRDNLNYKNELISFKELRNTIKEQLHAKQEEISLLLTEIDNLNSRLNSIAGEYEEKISALKNTSAEEIQAIKTELGKQIEELRSGAHYREMGVREEYEQKINSFTLLMSEKESDLTAAHESEVNSLKADFTQQIDELKNSYETKLSETWDLNTTEIDSLKNEYEGKLARLVDTFNKQETEGSKNFETQIATLQNELESQSADFQSQLTSTVEELTATYTNKELSLIDEQETQINTLISLAASETETLKADYEERLSNTLIHANSQNSKLTEDLNKFVLENEHFKEKIRELVFHIDEQNTKIEDLSREVDIKNSEIVSQNERNETLTSEFEAYKTSQEQSQSEQLQSLTNEFEAYKTSQQQTQSEQVQSLNNELSKLNETISELKAELEVKNNSVAELSSSVSSKAAELGYTKSEIERLNGEIEKLNLATSESAETFESFKSELEITTQQQLQAQEIEFKKLLTENSSLINEIDLAQDKVEAQEEELAILKAELAELSDTKKGRLVDLKDALDTKNFEITALTANNAGLLNENGQLKTELAELNIQLESSSTVSDQLTEWENKFNSVTSEKESLSLQLNELQTITDNFKADVETLNSKITWYENEMTELKSATKNNTEQDEYIDRLFKQIDALSNERLSLLNEKEEMTNQLLKMNDCIGNLSQEVDSQSINVNDLNNHRKNVILAKSSDGSGNEKTDMKKQINELVREIDKCIALLSA